MIKRSLPSLILIAGSALTGAFVGDRIDSKSAAENLDLIVKINNIADEVNNSLNDVGSFVEDEAKRKELVYSDQPESYKKSMIELHRIRNDVRKIREKSKNHHHRNLLAKFGLAISSLMVVVLELQTVSRLKEAIGIETKKAKLQAFNKGKREGIVKGEKNVLQLSWQDLYERFIADISDPKRRQN